MGKKTVFSLCVMVILVIIMSGCGGGDVENAGGLGDVGGLGGVGGLGVTNDPIAGMVLVQGGTFQLGDVRNDGRSDEKPVHTVNLMYDYYIGKNEVTFDEYDAYCDATGKTKPNAYIWGRGSRPVINVTWWDAIAYCNWLSEQEGLQTAYDNGGNLLTSNGLVTTDITQIEGYRLLTEAEWEYAARGGHEDITEGNEGNDYKYAGSNIIGEVAWYSGNSNWKTSEVGQKVPNELGIYDMSGNVYEWCHDVYGSYSSTTKINPIGSNTSSYRVGRGGSWYEIDMYSRVASRFGNIPSYSDWRYGLRVARTWK